MDQSKYMRRLNHSDSDLVAAIRDGLAELADPERALAMQAYMKSEMPFRGVQKPARAAMARQLFAAHPLPDLDTWQDTALRLWRDADYREERYLAIALTGDRRYRLHQVPAVIPMYIEMISTGAWWDYVDEIAARRIGPLLRSQLETVRPIILDWSRATDLWLRRTSIICQLGAKQETDLDLLTECLEVNLSDPDFFIRKAVGWALRDYAWTNPEWVRSWVFSHDSQLSGLSRREALKNI